MMIIIYADGGCRNNQSSENIGAWGAVLEHGSNKKEISGVAYNTTNNKMELQSAIEALKILKVTNVPVCVIMDSQYVVQGITSWIFSWMKNGWKTANKKRVENKELWIELYNLVKKFDNIKFEKCKGHSGNDGNERADQLCNEAMDLIK